MEALAEGSWGMPPPSPGLVLTLGWEDLSQALARLGCGGNSKRQVQTLPSHCSLEGPGTLPCCLPREREVAGGRRQHGSPSPRPRKDWQLGGGRGNIWPRRTVGPAVGLFCRYPP